MFDGKKFLTQNFHTAQHTATVVGTYGFSVKTAAVEKWFQRGSVPGNWLAILIAIKEIETGSPISVARYLRVGE